MGENLVSLRILNDEFDQLFNGRIILDQDVEHKLHNKHKVYKDDLSDALEDSNRLILKPKQLSTAPINKEKSAGKLYEILGETSSGRILFIVSRLFPDGKLYIVTSYWATKELKQTYYNINEVLRNEE